MKSSWNKISLVFLFCIALLGTFLRALPFLDVSLNYQNIVHAHSHVAFQGWIYTIIILLTSHLYLTKQQVSSGRYALQYKLTIPIILAILISFIWQGYGFYSILFSTFFQLLNYWFIFRFFKDTRSLKIDGISLSFIKIGFWLGLLSSFAPYFVGFLSAKGLANAEPYEAAIYFFLHFQYNGWFLFSAIGIFFKILEDKNILYDLKKARYFLLSFSIAVIPAYSLSLLGMSFRIYIIIPAVLSGILQLISLIIFLSMIRAIKPGALTNSNKWVKLFLNAALISFSLKITLQFLSIFPVFKNYAFGSRDMIMAYMHLSLIGVLSFLIIFVLLRLKWIKLWRLTKLGSFIFVLGFTATESILVGRAFGLSILSYWLIAFSGLMALGILFLIINPLQQNNQIQN